MMAEARFLVGDKRQRDLAKAVGPIVRFPNRCMSKLGGGRSENNVSGGLPSFAA